MHTQFAKQLHAYTKKDAPVIHIYIDSVIGNIDLDAVHDRAKLITVQQQDENLIALFDQVVERDFPIGKPYYYLKDGVLTHHDIVRQYLRNKILEMAHNFPA